MGIPWEKGTEIKFTRLIDKVPVFLRDMAREKIAKKAEALTRDADRTEISEQEMVDAFFAETPFGFHGPMKCDMEELGIDYTRYGHPR